jgi:oxaloacetate decarboxylase alpha subunit
VIAALVFTLSPFHDDAHYVDCARTLAACPDVDALYIKDPGGLLTPTRAATLIPAVMAVIGNKPLELHAHGTIGLADMVYADAPALGVSALQVASGAASEGTSNPSSARAVSNLKALGHTVLVDEEALAQVQTYFTKLASAEGLAVGKPMAFDAAYLHHQLPGGMVGTMRRQLTEARLPHLEAAVIEEMGRVRQELGWPIVMTPFAQMLQTQAFINVTGKERYATVPDEIIRYALGRFGRPNVPIDAEVKNRIEALPRTRELRAERDMAPLSELRALFGKGISDEEFLLRATMPGNLIDAMLAAGPAVRHYNPDSRPLLDLVRQLTARRDINHVAIEKGDIKLELRRWAR